MCPLGGSKMSKSKYKTRVRYTLDFPRQIIDLVRAGRPIPELVQQFGVTATSIHNWLRLVRKHDKPATEELTINEREELERLRRENRQLLMEREILSKARAGVGQGTVPKSEALLDS